MGLSRPIAGGVFCRVMPRGTAVILVPRSRPIVRGPRPRDRLIAGTRAPVKTLFSLDPAGDDARALPVPRWLHNGLSLFFTHSVYFLFFFLFGQSRVGKVEGGGVIVDFSG